MKQIIGLAIVFSLLTGTAPAIAATTGYVVRSEAGQVYIDFGSEQGAEVGQIFTIFKDGEELKHPVTGASLGKVEEKVGEGSIIDVREKYSIGRLQSSSVHAEPGQHFRIVEGVRAPTPAIEPAPAPSAAHTAQASNRTPYFRSPIINMMAVDIAIADATGDGAQDIVLASKDEIRVYPIRTDSKKWTPLCTYTENITGSRFLSVEAHDLDKDGRAEIFATYHSSFYKRIETHIFDCKDGEIKKRKTIPWLVRAYQNADGRSALSAQQLVSDKTFPFSGIFNLEYRDGEYAPSKAQIKGKRLEWLYGFTFAQRENPAGTNEAPDPFLLFYWRGGKIRAQYKKGAWSSREKYGQTSERVKWHGNELMFYPRMHVEHGPKGLTGVHTVRNIAGMFNLASAFGIYKNSELHFLKWNGMSLEPQWKTELTGYAAGLSVYGSGPSASLVIPVRGVEENTSIWFYHK